MNKVKSNLPNIITFINLSLGVVAILITVSDNSLNALIYASLLVMLAAVTDRFDGQVARKLNLVSALGKELDSLSDLISFGVAPVIIAWKINYVAVDLFGHSALFRNFGYFLVLVFPIAGAYRLAKFNITEFENFFMGVPITIAGGFLTIVNLYNTIQVREHRYSNIDAIITFAIIFVLSFLMISKFKIKKR